MKTETLPYPAACSAFYGAVVLFSNAAELVVVGVIDENERYLVSRTKISQAAIWENNGVVVEAVRQVHVKIDLLAYFHRGNFEAGMRLVDELNAIVPTIACQAAKEDLDEDRPVLHAQFGHRLSRVGLPAARKLATATIRNADVGQYDLAGVALAAEEYHRRHSKRGTGKKRLRTQSTGPVLSVTEQRLQFEIRELRAEVAMLKTALEIQMNGAVA